jgi:muramoyltetrapeptide carboxypeptidase
VDLTLFSPSGVIANATPLKLAERRLAAHGFKVQRDAGALLKFQRFAGTDEQRLQAIHRVALEQPEVAMATRGGYGLTRLLDGIDWKLLAKSVDAGTRWAGHSDFTALQMGLLAHTGAVSWCAPMACGDFGAQELDDVTADCFAEAMGGELEAVGFRSDAGFDGLAVRGALWGGNLSVLCAMLGTPHWPRVKGGILFLEDVAEHPYRVERMLLQLHQAGVLGEQKAVVLGSFVDWKKSPLDRGYTLKFAVQHLASVCKTPLLTGFPFGHAPSVTTKVTVPFGALVDLVVEGRNALVSWED